MSFPLPVIATPPQHRRLTFRQVPVVSFIIERFPQRLNYQDIHGFSCLSHAVVHERWELIDYLLTRPVNVFQVTKRRDNLLHLLAQRHFPQDELKTVEALLSKLVTHQRLVNGRNVLGETPLHLACLAANELLITRLLDNHARVFVPNNKGQTPWDYCQAADRIVVDLTALPQTADEPPSPFQTPRESSEDVPETPTGETFTPETASGDAPTDPTTPRGEPDAARPNEPSERKRKIIDLSGPLD